MPALFAAESGQAAQCFIKFFAANIPNRNIRAAYAHAAVPFACWCDAHRLSLAQPTGATVAAYIEELGAYTTVSILHALRDGPPDVISAMDSSGIDVFIGQALVAGIGLYILCRRWREARRLQRVEAEMAGCCEPICPTIAQSLGYGLPCRG